MKITMIENIKGGVAKTITAVHLAAMLAREGKKVLILDNDFQGNVATFFKIDKTNQNLKTMADVFNYANEETIRAAIQETDYENISIIAGSQDMQVTNKIIDSQPNEIGYGRLKTSIEYIKKDFDNIIIDHNASMTPNVISSFFVADEIIVPMEMDCFSAEGLQEIIKQMNQARAINPKIKLLGILLTRVSPLCKKRNQLALESLINAGYPMFTAMIHNSERMKKAIKEGIPLIYYRDCEKIRPARDFESFYEEYKEKSK